MYTEQQVEAFNKDLNLQFKKVEELAIQNIEEIQKMVLDRSKNKYNILESAGESIRKLKAKTTSFASFRQYADDEFFEYPASSINDIVPEQLLHTDVDYNDTDQYHQSRCLVIMPLQKNGCHMRLWKGSHAFATFNDIAEEMRHKSKLDSHLLVIHIRFGEFLVMNPKMIHSGCKVETYNWRMHMYVGIDEEEIQSNTTHFIPRHFYGQFSLPKTRKRVREDDSSSADDALSSYAKLQNKSKQRLRPMTSRPFKKLWNDYNNFTNLTKVNLLPSVACNRALDENIFIPEVDDIRAFEALSKPDVDRVNSVLSIELNVNNKFKIVSDDEWSIGITNFDFHRLKPSKWLNDDIILIYFYSLFRNSTENIFLNTHFFDKLYNIETSQYNYFDAMAHLPSWLDIFKYKKIFIPINIADRHWVLVVVYMERKEIYYIDSMWTDTAGRNLNMMRAILQFIMHQTMFRTYNTPKEANSMLSSVNDWQLIDTGKTVPQQKNYNDCGIFVAMCADKLSKNSRLTYQQEDADAYRTKIALAILDSPKRVDKASSAKLV